jgi:deoxyadenosine/deoxycytidine kinase
VTKSNYLDLKRKIRSLGYASVVIEGNIGVGKTSLGGRLVEERVDEDPLIERFYDDMRRYGFQTQLMFLVNRYVQQLALGQGDLFDDLVVVDYLFARDRIFAHVTLTDDELALYERIASLLHAKPVGQSLVVYLQASSDVLYERIQQRGRQFERAISRDYLDTLNEAFNHYFFNYSDGPLLVVNTDGMDFVNDERHFLDLVRRLGEPVRNTEFYVPSWGTK